LAVAAEPARKAGMPQEIPQVVLSEMLLAQPLLVQTVVKVELSP